MTFSLRTFANGASPASSGDPVLSHHDHLEAAVYALEAHRQRCAAEGVACLAYVWGDAAGLQMTYNTAVPQGFVPLHLAKPCRVTGRIPRG